MKRQARGRKTSATDAALILATGILKLALEISEDEPEYIVIGPARRQRLKNSRGSTPIGKPGRTVEIPEDEPEYIVIGPARRQRLENSRKSIPRIRQTG